MSAADRPQRILVTGAAGFIGSHTVSTLLDQGHEVVGVDDLSTGKRANIKEARVRGFRLVDDDMLTSGLLDEVTVSFRPDVIMHLAGFGGVALSEETPQRNFRLNVESTQLVAETARRRGVTRIVLASSAAVYGDLEMLPVSEDAMTVPKSNFGTAKLVSELLLAGYARSYGMTCVSTRIFNVYGRLQDSSATNAGVISIFADRFKRRVPVTIFGDGTQRRDFISVSDVARGLALAATRPGVFSGSYNLCTGVSHSLLELVKLLTVRYPGGPELTFAPEREGEIKHSQGDPSRTEEHLGFVASVPFGDGIRELLDPGFAELRRAA